VTHGGRRGQNSGVSQSDNPEDRAPFAGLVRSLLGLPPWNVTQGHGSFLTFNFGQPLPEVGDGRVHGEWHLWIYMSAWRIEDAGRVLAACEDDRVVISEALVQLDGRPLASIAAVGLTLDTVFDFGGLVLRTFSMRSIAAEHPEPDWMLFMPGRRVLSIGPGGAWACGPSDA
jgi:hypothetical protein